MTSFTDYEDHDATGLAELVRSGQVKATELTEAAIERIDRLNLTINAVVTPTFDRARQLAESGPPSGPFAGVPFLLKDLTLAWKGTRLTEGSRAMAENISAYTSTLVERYEAAGLVILGKTNTPELGLAPVTEPELHGVTTNPWDPSRTAGGSSGGSAAAVAAGMVPMASASDGGGSIRIPASQCGLFGLKPSRGRTPSGPISSEGWFGMTVAHAVTRTVRDSAALLDATHGSEPGDAYTAPAPVRPFIDEVDTDPGALKVGLIEGGVFHDRIAGECLSACSEAGSLLGDLGHTVEPIDLGVDPETTVEAFLTLVAASVSVNLDEFAAIKGQSRPDPDEYELATWILGLVGRKLSGSDVAGALEHIRRLGRTVAHAMDGQGVSLLMTPTLAEPPLLHGALEPTDAEQTLLKALRRLPAKPALLAAFKQLADKVLEPIPNTPLFNATGQPAMSVPLHWTDQNLPVGVQFAARYGDEATLFRLAGQLEQAKPWFNRRPPV